jgi:hypothetical protein
VHVKGRAEGLEAYELCGRFPTPDTKTAGI